MRPSRRAAASSAAAKITKQVRRRPARRPATPTAPRDPEPPAPTPSPLAEPAAEPAMEAPPQSPSASPERPLHPEEPSGGGEAPIDRVDERPAASSGSPAGSKENSPLESLPRAEQSPPKATSASPPPPAHHSTSPLEESEPKAAESLDGTTESVQLLEVTKRTPFVRDKEMKARRGTVFHLTIPEIEDDEDDEQKEAMEDEEEMEEEDGEINGNQPGEFASLLAAIPEETIAADGELVADEPKLEAETAAGGDQTDDAMPAMEGPSTLHAELTEPKEEADKASGKPNASPYVHYTYKMVNGKRKRVLTVHTLHPSLTGPGPTASCLRAEQAGQQTKTLRWADESGEAPLSHERRMTMASEQFGHNLRASTRKKAMFGETI
ncbi:hypothetical protein M3Y99_00424800 [Aphelenchoides fujianensis]|nr:hypothetical protein M3Y99_00424800 [Aphelenchoides fujianensis]